MKRKIITFLTSLLKLENKWISIILPVLVLGLFFFTLTINNIYTETYDIERFDRATQTIRSPVTIENEQETKRKTRETVQSVEDRFDISAEITDERIQYVEEVFDALAKLEEEVSNKEKDSSIVTNQEKVQQLKQILSSDITEEISEGVFFQLIQISSTERKKGRELLITSLSDIMEKGIRIENIQSAKADIEQHIKYSDLKNDLKKPLTKLSDFAVIENSFFDVEETMDARKDAASNVEPVVIRAGEVIVREGQTITNEIYEELALAGLLNEERNFYPVIGLSIFILLIVSIIGHEINLMARKRQLDRGKVISILLISVIVISLMEIVSLYTTQTNQLFYIVPAATGVLLAKQLLNERLVIILAMLYAVLGSVIFNSEIPGSLNVEAGTYFFFSQLAGIIFLVNAEDRLAIIRSGIGMAFINIVTVLIFIFLSIEKYSLSDIFIQSGFGVAAAFLSTVLTIGLLPFFETALGILTDTKLLALSSPNQPLLRKILTEAPGTYHHSIMVANLSETACEAVGANGLLARVGAYYHDIGKTIKPHYFIENQLSAKNPHDLIDPKQSAEIIINHPHEGADMLAAYRMPKEIIDIAKEHHGTTLLKYFFHKEKETNQYVQESEYRYPGPKPQSKEAAIISICDSVEAAVRSLKDPTEEKIEEIVSSIVNDRLLDGQLDESPLTIQELKKIHVTICATLKGIYHSRIQYPTKEAK